MMNTKVVLVLCGLVFAGTTVGHTEPAEASVLDGFRSTAAAMKYKATKVAKKSVAGAKRNVAKLKNTVKRTNSGRS